MITLPHPHRAYLKAFWIIMTLIASGLVIGTSLILGNLWGIGLGVGLGCIGMVYGLVVVNMRVMLGAYKTWNKFAGLLTEGLQTVIVAISFFVMFVVVGKLGTSLRLDMPKANQSLWKRRGNMPLLAYESQSSFPRPVKKVSHWGKFFISWATQSGKYWVWFLYPFLYVLSFLDMEPSDETPSGIYTLY